MKFQALEGLKSNAKADDSNFYTKFVTLHAESIIIDEKELEMIGNVHDHNWHWHKNNYLALTQSKNSWNILEILREASFQFKMKYFFKKNSKNRPKNI